MAEPAYSRVLLKVSGEALAGAGRSGIDAATVAATAREIREAASLGAQIAIVAGGGNILRGAQVAALGMDRCAADYAGMLATVINALALADALEKSGIETRVQSALPVAGVVDPFDARRAVRHLSKGRAVVFAGGTGNPYVTTDTAAALRAAQIDANALLMAKNGVDGIYDADPRKQPDAKRFATLCYDDGLAQGLKVMDAAALSICRDKRLPILVFDASTPGAIARAVRGEKIGTIVHDCETTLASVL